MTLATLYALTVLAVTTVQHGETAPTRRGVLAAVGAALPLLPDQTDSTVETFAARLCRAAALPPHCTED